MTSTWGPLGRLWPPGPAMHEAILKAAAKVQVFGGPHEVSNCERLSLMASFKTCPSEGQVWKDASSGNLKQMRPHLVFQQPAPEQKPQREPQPVTL